MSLEHVGADHSDSTVPTFAIFVNSTGAIPLDAARSRIIVRFRDSDGVLRGATSVAVTTDNP